jgi:hypothetical protein
MSGQRRIKPMNANDPKLDPAKRRRKYRREWERAFGDCCSGPAAEMHKEKWAEWRTNAGEIGEYLVAATPGTYSETAVLQAAELVIRAWSGQTTVAELLREYLPRSAIGVAELVSPELLHSVAAAGYRYQPRRGIVAVASKLDVLLHQSNEINRQMREAADRMSKKS